MNYCEKIRKSMIDGDDDSVVKYIKKSLLSGYDPKYILKNTGFIFKLTNKFKIAINVVKTIIVFKIVFLNLSESSKNAHKKNPA